MALQSSFLELLQGLAFQLDQPLAPHTTFKIGGPADVLVSAHNETEVLQILRAAYATGTPLFILGGGSNLLISDAGVRGCVLILKGSLTEIKVSESGDEIWVGAGASFPKLTSVALKLGWSRALGFCGTPGQVGGALKMNAGTRLGEIGDVVKEVHAVSTKGFQVFQKEDIQFSYRRTSFPKHTVLTKACLSYKNPSLLQADELLKTAEELAKKRKATQPKMRSAGSIFKNPPNDFAGRLIEAAGLKGERIGEAEVSQTHANFIVNAGQAKAQDVFDLSQKVRQEVYAKFHILLEYEVKLIGTFLRNKTSHHANLSTNNQP